MKKVFLLLIFIVGLCPQSIEAQEMLQINESTIIKNLEGKTINLNEFMTLMNSGDWMIDQKKDEDGKNYIQLKKATKEEKEMMQKMIENEMSQADLVGTDAKILNLKTIDGKVINSETTKNKVVVLNFWFAACKPCIQELPDLNEVYKKYKGNENVIFASITFESEIHVDKFLEKYDISYPVVANDTATINDYNISSYPTNIVIGKDGRIVDFISGGFPGVGGHIEAQIEKAIKN